MADAIVDLCEDNTKIGTWASTVAKSVLYPKITHRSNSTVNRHGRLSVSQIGTSHRINSDNPSFKR